MSMKNGLYLADQKTSSFTPVVMRVGHSNIQRGWASLDMMYAFAQSYYGWTVHSNLDFVREYIFISPEEFL